MWCALRRDIPGHGRRRRRVRPREYTYMRAHGRLHHGPVAGRAAKLVLLIITVSARAQVRARPRADLQGVADVKFGVSERARSVRFPGRNGGRGRRDWSAGPHASDRSETEPLPGTTPRSGP